jgi:membrane protein YqaA with SNARE-associated domain
MTEADTKSTETAASFPGGEPPNAVPPTRNPIRRLYRWVLGWACHPGGVWALFAIAFAESSFFPIPPDVLQVALSVGRPRRSFWFAAVSSAGSVLGGVLGYVIGYALFESVGRPILDLYGLQASFEAVGGYYGENAFLWIFLAALTPIPYKVFTIAAGVYHEQVGLWVLVAASAVGRPVRFFLVATLLFFCGERVKALIERYFEWLTILLGVGVVLGFVAIKYLR